MSSRYQLRRPKHLFTASLWFLTILIGTFIPFFSKIVIKVPFISLVLGQAALVLLFILATFPKANYRYIGILSGAYLAFACSCFLVLSLMPFAPAHKLFSIHDFTFSELSFVIAVNLISFVFINISCFTFMGLGFYLYKPVMSANVRAHASELDDEQAEKFKEKAENIKKELKTEMDSLFSSYVPDNEDVDLNQVINSTLSPEAQAKLERMEEVLVTHLDENIDEAICLDAEGKTLETSVFNWTGVNSSKLVNLFNEQNQSSLALKTGRLCQMLINARGDWYIMAKSKDCYLALKTKVQDISTLMDTTFKVFKSL